MQPLDLNTRERMIKLAKSMSQKAHCPYSGYPVGAAVLSDDGQVFGGCNVENASYGLSMCAERNAIFQMVAQGGQRIHCVVIYTPTDQPAAPCGSCRQVINEFGSQALIVCVGDGEKSFESPISELLPKAFGPDNLAAGDI